VLVLAARRHSAVATASAYYEMGSSDPAFLVRLVRDREQKAAKRTNSFSPASCLCVSSFRSVFAVWPGPVKSAVLFTV